MKKLLSLLLTIVVALGVLAGCGNTEEASNEAEGTTGNSSEDVVYRTLDEIKESGTV